MMSKTTQYSIIALGAVLRLLLIWNAGMWYDENFSLMLSRLPLLDMLAATAGDVHPPLYYLLIWPLGQIPGLPAWALRLPSALFSIVTLALYPRLLAHLQVPATVQQIAFVLLAIMPMQLHYAQEARMYALLEMLFALGVLAVFESRPLMLCTAATCLLYTQNYGLLYVATLFILTLLLRGPFIRNLLGAIAAAMIAWLPWLPVMQAQLAEIQGHYWIFFTPGWVLYSLWKLFWASSLNHVAGLMSSMIVTFAWLLVATWYLLTRRPAAWLQIGLLGYGPLILAVVASLFVTPMVLPRPLIGITPFLYLACAYPLGRIASMRHWLYAAAFLLPMFVTSLGGYYVFNKAQKEADGNGDVAAVTSYIRDNWRPGDALYFSGDSPYVNYSPYLEDLPRYLKPDCTERPQGALSNKTRKALHATMAPFDVVSSQYNRIWLVYVEAPLMPQCEVETMIGIIDNAEPVYVLRDERLIFSAIWLLDKED